MTLLHEIAALYQLVEQRVLIALPQCTFRDYGGISAPLLDAFINTDGHRTARPWRRPFIIALRLHVIESQAAIIGHSGKQWKTAKR